MNIRYKKTLLIEKTIKLFKKNEEKKGLPHVVSSSFEPKRKNRFVVEFPESFKLAPYFVQEVQRPKYIVDKGWSNIVIKFVDTVTQPISEGFFDLIQNKLVENSFEIVIKLLDPVGDVIEKWIIGNCKIILLDFGDISYKEEDIIMPTLTIKPKYCYLEF